ncbi:MAG: substrate-binding domain-containing protein, partial [Thermomicrobiales bacterium]
MMAGIILLMLIGGCTQSDTGDATTFHILTGSENRILFDDPNSDEPTMMERFEEEHDIDFAPAFQGSVDTMLDIQAGGDPYDAVWPASSIWLNLGDTEGIVSRTESIMGSPVVFGIKQS